jgi:hypothetical protein
MFFNEKTNFFSQDGDGEISMGTIFTAPDITNEAEALAAARAIMQRYYFQTAHRGAATDGLEVGGLLSGPYFDAVADKGKFLPSHGMTKGNPGKVLDDLLSLFRNGIDTDTSQGRRGYLCTASLCVPKGHGIVGCGATATGTSYRDGPFILVARAGTDLLDDMGKIAGVLVNPVLSQSYPEIIRALEMLLPPTVMVRDYESVADVVDHAYAPPSVAAKSDVPGPQGLAFQFSTYNGTRGQMSSLIVEGDTVALEKMEGVLEGRYGLKNGQDYYNKSGNRIVVMGSDAQNAIAAIREDRRYAAPFQPQKANPSPQGLHKKL